MGSPVELFDSEPAAVLVTCTMCGSAVAASYAGQHEAWHAAFALYPTAEAASAAVERLGEHG